MSSGSQLDLANKEHWQEIRRKKCGSEFLFLQLLLRRVTAEQLRLSTQGHGCCQVALLILPAVSPALGYLLVSSHLR